KAVIWIAAVRASGGRARCRRQRILPAGCAGGTARYRGRHLVSVPGVDRLAGLGGAQGARIASAGRWDRRRAGRDLSDCTLVWIATEPVVHGAVSRLRNLYFDVALTFTTACTASASRCSPGSSDVISIHSPGECVRPPRDTPIETQGMPSESGMLASVLPA